MKLIDYLDHGALLYAERVCLQHDDGDNSYTYRQVADITKGIANGLIGAGLHKGSRFAVYSPNHSLAFIAVLGGLRIGARWVNLNVRTPLADILDTLYTNDCEFLFVHSSLLPCEEAVRSRLRKLKGIRCIDTSMLDWAANFDTELPDLVMGEEEIAVHFSTGGTTGKPKVAQLSNRATTAMSTAFLTFMHFEQPPVNLVVAPLTHAAGALVFPLLSAGATNVIVTQPAPGAILTALQEHGVNVVFLPPTLIYMLLAQPDVEDYDYSSLKYFLYAAAPIAPPKLAEAIRVFGPVMMQTYGQVEAPMILTCMTPSEHAEAANNSELSHRLASCGRPTVFARVEIMDEDGNLLPVGEKGEIVCRGPLVMSGYFRNPQETKAAGLYGWHHTGDIGYRDEDGFFYIVDRKKDLIISGGFNIYPSEIEAHILRHESVQDCAVIGAPDEKWGEAVTAVLQLKPDAGIDEEELIRGCKEALGSIKAPKRVDVWEQLPRSAVGKVLKKAVRDKYWEGHDRAI